MPDRTVSDILVSVNKRWEAYMQQLSHIQGNSPSFISGLKNKVTGGIINKIKPEATVAFSGAQLAQFGDTTGVLMPRFSGAMAMAGQSLNIIA